MTQIPMVLVSLDGFFISNDRRPIMRRPIVVLTIFLVQWSKRHSILSDNFAACPKMPKADRKLFEKLKTLDRMIMAERRKPTIIIQYWTYNKIYSYGLSRKPSGMREFRDYASDQHSTVPSKTHLLSGTAEKATLKSQAKPLTF
jgi:hypothetical protein